MFQDPPGSYEIQARSQQDLTGTLTDLAGLGSRAGYLGFSSGLSGVCSDSTTITAVASIPSGYSASVTVFGTLFYLTLSSDSKTINAINSANSACNGIELFKK
ncbi:unnamed protein product [Didymodactylos carnosus]|uniref:Uncharacterized protein n=1 Tax=Didymodactylos carnosus TaxID=1234261 RepID=A0A8S2IRS7_9BILA|nr:unnamed protein product [Didymodactylos carnosus]CAF3771851.1 unnamed protein product [Didymodactylos carnosus]